MKESVFGDIEANVKILQSLLPFDSATLIVDNDRVIVDEVKWKPFDVKKSDQSENVFKWFRNRYCDLRDGKLQPVIPWDNQVLHYLKKVETMRLENRGKWALCGEDRDGPFFDIFDFEADAIHERNKRTRGKYDLLVCIDKEFL